MTDALVATDVHRRYGDVDALAGVSLSIARGEVFALVGPNGAGKTTLVRALTGTTSVDAGSVSLLGATPRDADTEAIGVLPQSFAPPGRLTAREVIAYYAGLYEDARSVVDVLDAVGVTDVAGTYYEDLSGGEQRRVCLGATLVNDPDVLFLDEPTTGIDPVGRRTIWGLIDDHVASGTTVFLTTHDMREAQRLADRVGLLAAGELVAVGSPTKLIEEYAGPASVTVTVDTDATPNDTADATASEHSDATASEHSDANASEHSDANASEHSDATASEHADANADATAVAVAAADVLDGAGFDVTVRGRDVVVSGVDARDAGAVADALDGAGVAFSELAWRTPDLEDVYLELTGERYADTYRRGDDSSVGAGDAATSSSVGDEPGVTSRGTSGGGSE